MFEVPCFQLTTWSPIWHHHHGLVQNHKLALQLRRSNFLTSNKNINFKNYFLYHDMKSEYFLRIKKMWLTCDMYIC